LNAVEIDGLTKRFGPVTAVDDLTLGIPRGCMFGLLGVNGAGKSTTLAMLMGLLAPDSGRVRILEMDLREDPLGVRQRVGYVPETPTCYPWMSVGEIAAFCRPLYGGWNDTLCRDLSDLFELRPDRRVRDLSKGMRAKLHLLLALAHEPDLLILDEPLSGLDPTVREEFTEGVLHGVNDRECTVLFSSHQIADVQRLADRVGILHGGRLLVEESVGTLVGGTRRIEVVLRNGRLPAVRPKGIIYERRERRLWRITVRGTAPTLLGDLRADPEVESAAEEALDLEAVFKDAVRGWRASA
jgi:ABC-2 type transport system ATP-binding protein